MSEKPQKPDRRPDHANRDDGYRCHLIEAFLDGALTTLQLALPDTREFLHLAHARSARAHERRDAYEEVRRRTNEMADRANLGKAFDEEDRKLDDPDAITRDFGRYRPEPASKSGKYVLLDERERLQRAHEKETTRLRDQPNRQQRMVPIYGCTEPIRLIDRTNGGGADRHLRERDARMYEDLKALGAYRQVTSLRALGRILKQLQGLERDQPHFAEVTRFIRERMTLARLNRGVPRIPPLLLLGAPGVGKTHYTLELARILARPIHRHNLDVAHTSSSLMGSARNWANTHTGLVFESVCMGTHAGPVILLDEIDKASDRPSSDPLAPLHSLLEPSTAKKVKDLSAGIEFDASHVCWIATANDLQRVPLPIQSRFHIFRVQEPTAEQSISLAKSIIAMVRERVGSPRLRLAPRLAMLVAHLTPREQIKALECACARASASGRLDVLREDLPVEVLADDAPGSVPARLH